MRNSPWPRLTIPERLWPTRAFRALGALIWGATIGLLLWAAWVNAPDALDTILALLGL